MKILKLKIHGPDEISWFTLDVSTIDFIVCSNTTIALKFYNSQDNNEILFSSNGHALAAYEMITDAMMEYNK